MKISNFLKRFWPAPKVLERRESERSALSLPVQILAEEQEAVEATVVEMSPSGARVHLSSALNPGQPVRVKFLTGGIRLAAHCRWARPRAESGWVAGLQFDP